MSRVILIEDDRHSELQKTEYAHFQEALEELARRAAIPWDEPPDRAPCTSWRTCGREYSVVEFDKTKTPWEALRHAVVLRISAKGAVWSDNYAEKWAARAPAKPPATADQPGG